MAASREETADAVLSPVDDSLDCQATESKEAVRDSQCNVANSLPGLQSACPWSLLIWRLRVRSGRRSDD